MASSVLSDTTQTQLELSTPAWGITAMASLTESPSDANAALKTLCGRYQWRSERAVLFLDPFGMHVEWSTLEAIAKTGAVDVWYLFPYAGLYRQAAKNADALDADKEASRLCNLFSVNFRGVGHDAGVTG